MESENTLAAIKESLDMQMKFEKFKYLHDILFSYYEPLQEAVSFVQTNVAEIRAGFNQETELKTEILKTNQDIIQKMKDVNAHYLNLLDMLEKTYPAMKLSFQAWNIYWEIDDTIQNINTCLLNKEFETTCFETYFSIIDDMIFDVCEQLQELTSQLKNEVSQLNDDIGWTYRM